MNLYYRALFVIALMLLLHAGLLLFGGYAYLHVDTFMHLLGGFAVGLLGLAIHHTVATTHHKNPSPWWYHYLFVAGFAMIVGTAWEFHEFILDQSVHTWYNLPMHQLSLADTMKDLLMDWLGASVAFFWFRKQS